MNHERLADLAAKFYVAATFGTGIAFLIVAQLVAGMPDWAKTLILTGVWFTGGMLAIAGLWAHGLSAARDPRNRLQKRPRRAPRR